MRLDFPGGPAGCQRGPLGLFAQRTAQPPLPFLWLPPQPQQERRRELEKLKDLPYPIIFYEAPHRLTGMLQDVLAVLGDRRASISRELTKLYEETRRGRLSELMDHFKQTSPGVSL